MHMHELNGIQEYLYRLYLQVYYYDFKFVAYYYDVTI